MFHLPPTAHKARAFLGDMSALADTLHPTNAAKLRPVWQIVRDTRPMFGDRAVKRVYAVTVRFDTGERWLISVGRKGGWRKEWNFGAG